MSAWQPDQHKDKLDEFVFVDISMQRPGQARPLDASPHARARPSPAFVNISKCQAKSPSMQTSAEHWRISFIFPSLFIYARPPSPLLPQLRQETIKQQGRPKKDEQRQAFRAERGIFRWRMWLAKVEVELSGLKGGQFPAEDSTSSGHKGSDWGLLGKAANTCSLFRGHNGEVKLQPPPPVGLGCPGFAGTQRGS